MYEEWKQRPVKGEHVLLKSADIGAIIIEEEPDEWKKVIGDRNRDT